MLILEALDELGLKPVCVAGTSIGAVVGVLYCSGQSGREIRESILQMTAREDDSLRDLLASGHLFKWLEFVAPQFNGTGLLKAERVVEFLFQSIPAKTFEELRIPLRMVTADFWSRDEVVLDSGPLQPAVQASMSLPGIFSPCVIGERVLVDGGAVNPVPFDLLPDDCTITVAIDAIGRRDHEQGVPPSLSEAVFNTFQIMEKSIVRARLRSRPPDIYLELDATDVRLLEFHKARQILAQAERAKDAFKRALDERLGKLEA